MAKIGLVELEFGDVGIGNRISGITSKNFSAVRVRLSRGMLEEGHGLSLLKCWENITQMLRDCGVVPVIRAGESKRSWMNPGENRWAFSDDAFRYRMFRKQQQYKHNKKKRELPLKFGRLRTRPCGHYNYMSLCSVCMACKNQAWDSFFVK